ncbi:hypothetical protein FPQ18DRAFT_369896 [Pyronema domesticum]|nr:hypothetical protein FPQ18DRAFT_369896 [Pyronema domesticum]
MGSEIHCCYPESGSSRKQRVHCDGGDSLTKKRLEWFLQFNWFFFLFGFLTVTRLGLGFFYGFFIHFILCTNLLYLFVFFPFQGVTYLRF